MIALPNPRSWPWRPVPFAIACALLLTCGRGDDVDTRAKNRSAALVGALAARGLSCAEGDVTWIEGPSGVHGAMTGGARALVRATTHGNPADLYLVAARLSPEGVLLDVGGVWNVTRTIGADESRPVLDGSIAAYTTSLDGVTTGVHAIDLAGHSPLLDGEFTKVQRWQLALTNLQQTGSFAGVTHDAYALDPPATNAAVSWDASHHLVAIADGRRVVIDVATGTAIEGAGWVRPAPEERARPGNLVTWSVDRVRAMPWFGEENMQWVKAIAFTALDWFLRSRERLFGDSGASEVAQDLGGVNAGEPFRPTFTDPEIGWPPAAIKPVIHPPLPGEGQWIALDRDPFITANPGAPPAFVTTYVRTDKARPQTRVYVTLWDTRQIALHMVAGTVEPVSATGEAGPGTVPRAPEVFRKVVGGFNGGFQAIHGEYGMQADGVLYLPPKPYAATVMELRDGATAFGSWPESIEVPDEVLSYRQNLTALVEGGKFNPWRRVWWGGTPKGWKDDIHTTRSGVCLTKENFAGYFWGNDISYDVLADAMIAAGCSYGVHLDMNPGLAGFEFYDVETSATWKPLGRPLQSDWEWEGTIKDLPDFHVRARRMIKGMQHVNFPQYIHHAGRDFFYLTQRTVLPGPELPVIVPPREPGEGAWRTKGLPQHGFPYAAAIAWTRLDPKRPALKARVLRLDPRTVVGAGTAGTTADTPTVVSFVAPIHRPKDKSEAAVWLAGDVLVASSSPPTPDALDVVTGALVTPATRARVVVGVQDEDGMLIWVELDPAAQPDAETTATMDALVAKLGCGTRLALDAGQAFLGAGLDLGGDPATPPPGPATRLVRTTPPSARLYFETAPVPPSVWQPLEMQRVRYFNKPKKKKPESDAGAP